MGYSIFIQKGKWMFLYVLQYTLTIWGYIYFINQKHTMY